MVSTVHKVKINEQLVAIDVGIAEMVSFISQGFCNLSLYWKMLNVETCTAGFGRKFKWSLTIRSRSSWSASSVLLSVVVLTLRWYAADLESGGGGGGIWHRFIDSDH